MPVVSVMISRKQGTMHVTGCIYSSLVQSQGTVVAGLLVAGWGQFVSVGADFCVLVYDVNSASFEDLDKLPEQQCVRYVGR